MIIVNYTYKFPDKFNKLGIYIGNGKSEKKVMSDLEKQTLLSEFK